jgi:hypothetical protein
LEIGKVLVHDRPRRASIPVDGLLVHHFRSVAERSTLAMGGGNMTPGLIAWGRRKRGAA